MSLQYTKPKKSVQSITYILDKSSYLDVFLLSYVLVIMYFLYFSEMFMDTNKFSTKTLSAINNLEGAVIRKKQEYNWRKEMEE